jgi:alkyldihydroxyacetonephosphate synthase
MRAVSAASIASLLNRLPADTVTIEPDALSEGAHDRWTLDLLRLARGDLPDAPDAIASPSSTDEVATVLRWASEAGTPVVPRGGGSGVCGAARAGPGSIVLNLSRMNRVLDVDEVSRVVRVEAGIRGDALEAALGPHGLTVGHYPQSIELSTVGGWIAAASAGQASAGFGAIEDRLLGLTAVTAGGEVLRLRAVPRSAMGPDLRRLLVGSEGAFAVVTEATLACAMAPRELAWDAFGFGSFDVCLDGLRRVMQAEPHALVVRGYDQADATLAFGRMGHPGGPVAIFGFDATSAGVTERRAAAADALGEGAHALGSAYGEHWWAHRNDTVRTYHRVMGEERMLGSGVVVDTIEVAALWRDVPALYANVRTALLAGAEAVGCHLSHPYPSGASLYFTFLVRGADDRAVEDVYRTAWATAARACLAAGGTLSHHHGVGLLKAPFLDAELGATGASLLRRMKAAVDPAGILNPGKLGDERRGPR